MDLALSHLQCHQPGLLPAAGMFLYSLQEQHLLRILSHSSCFNLSPEPQRGGTAPVIPLYLGAGADLKT